MAVESHITDITRVIQLAVAPVFLLTAVGTILTALTNRLGRIVDRRRFLEEQVRDHAEAAPDSVYAELRVLESRIKLVYFATALAVLCALFICLSISGAFVGAFISADLSKLVAVMFVLAMFALVCCLLMLLREVFLAVTGTRHRPH